VEVHRDRSLQMQGADISPPSLLSTVQRLAYKHCWLSGSSFIPPPHGSAWPHLTKTSCPARLAQVTAPRRNMQSALFVLGALDICSRKTSDGLSAAHTGEQMAEELCFGPEISLLLWDQSRKILWNTVRRWE